MLHPQVILFFDIGLLRLPYNAQKKGAFISALRIQEKWLEIVFDSNLSLPA